MLTPVNFIHQEDCTGCECCIAACGTRCISMVKDQHGFYYPYVETERCVNCGACEKTCPVLNLAENKTYSSSIYACRANDVEIVKDSSSGGLFTIIANHVLDAGGYVCGASWNNDYSVVHKVIDDKSHLADLRGSKYVQSHTADALSILRKLKRNGSSLLFVGTPCQVAGAKRLLGSAPQTDMIFVEVVCHGVPSPGVFGQYVKELESDYHSKISSLNFRDKSAGWKSYRFKASFKNGETFEQEGRKNPYLCGFVNNLFLRSCCFSCKFKCFKSGADITLGDFWGVELLKNHEYMDDRGVSLVCLNSALGEDIFSAIKHNLIDITATDLNIASRTNSCIVRSTEYNLRSERFYRFLKYYNFSEAVVMAMRTTFMDKVRISLKYRLDKFFNAQS